MKMILILAGATLLSAAAGRAEVITKGGASALVKTPVVSGSAPSATMPCAGCKSDFVTVKSPAFKATEPTTAIVERHACASCGTKWVTTGHGKAKVDVAVHTCGECRS